MTKSFYHNGIKVTVFRSENDTMRWCLRIGANVYSGYKTRVAAVSAVSDFI
jgi:hypothetical protein